MVSIGFIFLVCLFSAEDVVRFDGIEYSEPKVVGHIASKSIIECSGLAASRIQPVIWVHNDSGDSARIFALKGKGELAGIINLQGAKAIDWEDIAIGPHPKVEYAIYIGDIGDNSLRRTYVRVYRVPEPALKLEGDPLEYTIRDYDYFDLIYPDKPHNAEALLVDPDTGDLYIVTKEISGTAIVFSASSPSPWQRITLKKIASIKFGITFESWVTGGDISPDGRRILIRTYGYVFMLRRPQGKPLWEAFKQEPVRLPAPAEILGEAIGFSATGVNYYTISEGLKSPVYRIDSKKISKPVKKQEKKQEKKQKKESCPK